MSKSSKARSKLERAKVKRSRKEANRAYYAELTRRKENSKRTTNRDIIEFNPYRHTHQVSNCGNLGCNKCHDLIQKQWKQSLINESNVNA